MKIPKGCAVLVLIGAVLSGSVSGAAEIVLDAPRLVQDSFDGSTLEIPVSLTGSEAVLQLVVVQALDYNVPPWTREDVPTPEERFVQGLDPLVYVGPQLLCQEGYNIVKWYWRDMDDRLVLPDWFRYYVLAFVPGSVPDSLDYGIEHRREIYENVAAIVTGYITVFDAQPHYPLAHFTDMTESSVYAKVSMSSWFQSPMEEGDEIGVFSPRGDLVGAYLVFPRILHAGSFRIQGDDPATPEIKGMLEGEAMTFVIWDNPTDTELPARATFATSDSLYVSGVKYTLEALHVIDTTAVTEAPPAPFTLFQNSPNPFNPVTAIPYSLAEPSDISLIIYNATGAKVAVLAEGSYPAGRHTAHWDASDHASGMYFYRLHADGSALTGKMLLVK